MPITAIAGEDFAAIDVLLVFGAPLPTSLAGGAGARPDHPITRNRRTSAPSGRALTWAVGSSRGRVVDEFGGDQLDAEAAVSCT